MSESATDRLRMDETVVRLAEWSLSLRGDEVAEICWRGVRLLRGVRPVVRDADWNTIAVRVQSQRVVRSNDLLVVETELSYLDEATFLGGVRYRGSMSMTVSVDGTLDLTFTGIAESRFARNRIGLVVLHPVEDAGQPVQTVHSDGSVRDTFWPRQISPHQPFRDLVGFRWVRGPVGAELVLSGDVFETEDQRNWTDASFKTYSTPLELPFPVTVEPGDVVRQSLTLRVGVARLESKGGRPRSGGCAVPDPEPVQVGLAHLRTRSPGIPLPGIGVSGGADVDPASVVALGPNLESVLVEVGPGESVDPGLVLAASGAAPLDVRLVTDDLDELRGWLGRCAGAPIRRIGVFAPGSHVTTPEAFDVLRAEVFRWPSPAGIDQVAGPELVAGARAHFTELNRRFAEIPPDASALTFSLTPQMHATEPPHILDSLRTQAIVARNAVRLADGRSVHVGPITLRRRFNAVATSARAPIEGPDPLQGSRFESAWTLASVAALTRFGITTLHYGAVPGGPVDDSSPTPAGRLLRDLSGYSLLPAYRVLCPAQCAGLAVLVPADDRRPARVRVWLANLSPRDRLLTLDDGSTLRLAGWGVRSAALPIPSTAPDRH
ncbi:MAG: hypothetical protein ACK5MT_20175 [Actinomycetales bacterium]